MADITIKLTNICTSNPPIFKGTEHTIAGGTCLVYTIRNICTLLYEMDSPIQVIPIPETQVNFTGLCQVNCEGEGPIILKIEGNTMNINITWTIRDEEAAVATGGTPALPVIKTAEDQLEFLFTTFQNRSIAYGYQYNGSGFVDINVLLQKVSATLEGRSPVVYRGNMVFTVGQTAAVNEA